MDGEFRFRLDFAGSGIMLKTVQANTLPSVSDKVLGAIEDALRQLGGPPCAFETLRELSEVDVKYTESTALWKSICSRFRFPTGRELPADPRFKREAHGMAAFSLFEDTISAPPKKAGGASKFPLATVRQL